MAKVTIGLVQQPTEGKTVKTYNVTVKNWKTGEVVSQSNGVSAEEVAKMEADHHAWAPANWDMEVTPA